MNWLSFPAPAGRHRVVYAVIVLAAVVLSASCAPSALATTAPFFLHREFHYEAFSTRVTIEANPGLNFGGLETEWKAEYSTSCEAPPSSWTEANKETQPLSQEANIRIRIGVPEDLLFTERGQLEGGAANWLRGLAPDTSYCARFRAKNADGEATPEVVAFKTLPAAKPEVNQKEQLEYTPPAKGHPQFIVSQPVSTTAAGFTAAVKGNGAETTYAFEYAPAEAGGARPVEGSASWKQFTSGAAGTIGVAEEHATVSASLTGLNPETTYFVRLKMRNSIGEAVQIKYTNGDSGEEESFTTLTTKPIVGPVEVRNRTSDSARVVDAVSPHGSETSWRFEYAESVIGPWTSGGAGTIPQAQIETNPHGYGGAFRVGGALTGLIAGRKYYVRLFVENAAGEGEYCHNTNPEICEALSAQMKGLGSFATVGPPSSLTTFVVHGLVGEALQLDGSVDPEDQSTSAEQTIMVEGAPTGGTFTLTFAGHETTPIEYDAPADEGEAAGSVEAALAAIIGNGVVNVEGSAGGPYTVFFDAPGYANMAEPQIEANGSGLVPSSGKVVVHTNFKGGEAEKTNYRFEYVSQASFAEDGWSGAEMTPEAAGPVSDGSEVVMRCCRS